MEYVDHTAEKYLGKPPENVDLDINKILLATEGSYPALKATRFAVGLAKLTGATITAVFVRTGEAAILYPEERLHEDVSSGVHSSEAGLLLAEKIAEKNRVKCDIRILRGGVAPQIVKTAENEGYDLIIMGNTGREGLARLSMGSVAEAVVRNSTVPVLVFKK